MHTQYLRLHFANGYYYGTSRIRSTVARSADGLSWERLDLPGGAVTDLAFGNGLLVAVRDATENSVFVSSNGVDWATVAAPGGDWRAVTFGNGMFIAVGQGTPGRLMYSHNGYDWHEGTLPIKNPIDITFGSHGLMHRFVAVSYQDESRRYAATSIDGFNWRADPIPFESGMDAIAFGGGNFVGLQAGDDTVLVSQNGFDWELRETPSTFSEAYLSGIAFGQDRFIVSTEGNQIIQARLLDE